MVKATRKCSVEDCEMPAKTRDWCHKHYSRWLRHGDPMISLRSSTPEESLKKYTEWRNGCLVWNGYGNNNGYGRISVKGRQILVHRHVWEKASGAIPEGMQIDHVCHNRGCVNIEHLRLVTIQQNQFNRSGAQINSKSGVRNVHKFGEKWRVVVTRHGVKHHFGLFENVEDAEKVAKQKRSELFGDHSGK